MLDRPCPRILVIGFGNTLRGDDGLGPLIADQVERWGLSNVRTLALAQLAPELAVELAGADLAIFVDASAESATSGVQVEMIKPLNQVSPALIHASSARFLLGLCQAAYGRLPRSYVVCVPAVDFALGEGLSDLAVDGMRQALHTIRELIARRVFLRT